MNAEDQYADSPHQPKSRSAPEFHGLSRCAACYNQRATSSPWWRGDGESSSSAEDSGPEVDWESETESTPSSSCSGEALSEISEETETPSPVSDDAAEPDAAGEDGEGREEAGDTSESQEDKSGTRGVTQKAPLVKSFSLLASFTPHLTPLSLLPRPHTVVSTLHLQVLPRTRDDDSFYIIKKHLSEGEDEKTEGSTEGRREGVNDLLRPQTGLTWPRGSQPTSQQHQLSYEYKQQQLQQPPQHCPLLSAQGQRLPPALHTLPVLHPSTLHTPLQAPNSTQTHLHVFAPQPCWCCYSRHFPYSPYWSHDRNGHLPR